MVVDGSQVVWSPFSVVNVLPLINGDESLKEGFKNSIDYFKVNGTPAFTVTTEVIPFGHYGVASYSIDI